MQREENATTEGQKKLPQAGEYWQNMCEDRVLIHGVTQTGAVLFEYESGYGSHLSLGAFLPWWTHLPDCTGWDWVPEVWPKWYVHRDTDQQWYVRRYDANNAVMVLGVAPDWDRPWYTEWDGHAKAGFWIEVTESEAKARLTPPIPNCPDCGKPDGPRHADVCPMAWVTQDRVPARPGIDQWKLDWGSSWITDSCMAVPRMHRFRDEDGTRFVRCRRKDLPPEPCSMCGIDPVVPGTAGCENCTRYAREIVYGVPEPVKTKIPLRAWISAKLIDSPSGYAMCWFSQDDLQSRGMTEVHGLNLYIEDPSASGSGDAAEEASALG